MIMENVMCKITYAAVGMHDLPRVNAERCRDAGEFLTFESVMNVISL